MKHEVKFIAGYDCMRFECPWGKADCKPESLSSHGAHGLEILFVASGDEGAVTFTVMTGWLPVATQDGRLSCGMLEDQECHKAMGGDLMYHSRKPMYEGQSVFHKCAWLDGEPCYCDGTSVGAHEAFYTLRNGGAEALWKFLDQYYMCQFHGGEYPEMTEYCKPERKK